MRQLALAGLLAGCATSVPFDDPCACVIMPVANGTIAARLDGRQLTFDIGGDVGATAQAMTAFGSISWVGNGASDSGLDVEGEGILLSATWGTAGVPDLTAAAPLLTLEYEAWAEVGVDVEGSASYRLGPQGGTLRIREIAGDAANGWRVRGSFSGQVCTDPDRGTGCAILDGSFAFDAADLPPGAADSGLVVAG